MPLCYHYYYVVITPLSALPTHCFMLVLSNHITLQGYCIWSSPPTVRFKPLTPHLSMQLPPPYDYHLTPQMTIEHHDHVMITSLSHGYLTLPIWTLLVHPPSCISPKPTPTSQPTQIPHIHHLETPRHPPQCTATTTLHSIASMDSTNPGPNSENPIPTQHSLACQKPSPHCHSQPSWSHWTEQSMSWSLGHSPNDKQETLGN